jgi:hypothetical protein
MVTPLKYIASMKEGSRPEFEKEKVLPSIPA